MAAINPIVVRELSELVKRKSWPAKNVGVMVVFCIVFVVAAFLISLFFYKKIQKRNANKPQL